MPTSLDTVFRLLHEYAVLQPVLMLRGEGAFKRHLSEYKQAQYCGAGELEKRTRERLAAALVRARSTVPYYSDSLKSAGRFEVSTVIERMRFLPFISKADVQSNLRSLSSTEFRGQVTRKTTGGSTGQAVTVLKDRSALAREMAMSALCYGWFGVEVADKQARFWGSPSTTRRKLRVAAASFATRRINFSAFAFSPKDLDRYWRNVSEYHPAFLYGYVSMLEAFASHLRQREIDGGRLGLKSIVTTSEVLTTTQRRLIEDVFKTRVQNEYGCGEVGPIAYECPKGSLHVASENLFVEIIGPDGMPVEAGETGEVVVTDLHNRAMPLIRYRVGDNSLWGGPCECGRSWPVLQRVWGRAYDFIQDQSGRKYHGEYIMYIFEDLRDKSGGVRQFQVTQRAKDRIEVDIVSEGDIDAATTNEITRIFATRLPGMAVSVRRVAAIERSKSGKLQLIKNLIASAPTAGIQTD